MPRRKRFADAAGRQWTQAESEAAFDLLGDRAIDSWRRAMRDRRRLRLQQEVYSVGSVALTRAQVDALEALVRQPSWRMQEIARALEVDPSTATRTIEPLVRLGLVERGVDPADRRNAVLQVTELGRRECRQIEAARRALMRDVLGRLAPERRLLFVELLEEWMAAHEAVAAERDTSPGGVPGSVVRKGVVTT